MSEIRLTKIANRSLLSPNETYAVIRFASTGEAIWNGSKEIPRESCDRLAGTWAFIIVRDRLVVAASKVGVVGSLKYRGGAYDQVNTVPLRDVKEMFCTSCGAFLDKGQRHECNAPRCPECGSFLSPVDVKNGRTICTKCRAKLVAKIFSYHCWDEAPIFQKPEKRSDVLEMGTEWETSWNGSYDDKAASVVEISAVANPNPWRQNLRFMRDGSITGVEMITEPKTLKGYMASAELKAAIEKAKNTGHFITDSNGAHIHLDRMFFGKKHKICAAMLCYLVAVYWDDFFLPLSMRHGDFTYCQKPNASKDDNIIDVHDKCCRGGSNHYTAVNCGNENTIELRFWSGTLDWDVIIARFDISRAMAIWAKKTSSDKLMEAKPSDFFRYIENPETFDYIRSHITNSEILAQIPG